ncbi:hypothetical protein LUW77_26570 [Streptomyces radiopugnans]|nr:hypothetical protein LUW77_26570 [Streptomyces radiopugnans]
MPEPGSKDYDKQRARRRKEAERSGVPDRHANEEANESLQQDPRRAPPGRAPSAAAAPRANAPRAAERCGPPGGGPHP